MPFVQELKGVMGQAILSDIFVVGCMATFRRLKNAVIKT
jgi:hypothetical protein